MSEYNVAVKAYNEKINRLREDMEDLSDDRVEQLSDLQNVSDIFGQHFEELLFELTEELSDSVDEMNTEKYEVTSDLSRALYKLDQIADAAQDELEDRE